MNRRDFFRAGITSMLGTVANQLPCPEAPCLACELVDPDWLGHTCGRNTFDFSYPTEVEVDHLVSATLKDLGPMKYQDLMVGTHDEYVKLVATLKYRVPYREELGQ